MYSNSIMVVKLKKGEIMNYKLDTDKQIFFYEQEFYVLSNFSAFNLRWAKGTFMTAEHAYQWEKFTDFTTSNLIFFAPSAHDAFKLAQEHKDKVRSDWDSIKVDIMYRILKAKVEQHEYVKCKLLETGDRELIEDSWRDDFWGWGVNKNGQNKLGKLWMKIREELKK